MTLSLNDEACPVPLELLGTLYRADAHNLTELLDGIPEASRVRLAVYLYGRSHTHRLGLTVAATCGETALRQAAGFVGDALFVQSRAPASPDLPARPSLRARISLGGSVRAAS